MRVKHISGAGCGFCGSCKSHGAARHRNYYDGDARTDGFACADTDTDAYTGAYRDA